MAKEKKIKKGNLKKKFVDYYHFTKEKIGQNYIKFIDYLRKEK
jgi:hypothetical protein